MDHQQDMEEDLVVVDDSEIVPEETSTQQQFESVDAVMAADTADGPLPLTTTSEPKGKTPYTSTMKLKRGPKGYGFSVTWTHPPR